MVKKQHSVTIVFEMDNAEMLDWAEVEGFLKLLLREIVLVQEAGRIGDLDLVFVLPGSAAQADELGELVKKGAPELNSMASLKFFGVPDGRYYELKNEGVKHASGDLVVLFDSDIIPEKGWLGSLLAPFDDQNVTAVNGYTSLQYDNFLSRVYALHWIFPLRHHDDRKAAKRSLNANNCAFRREWIQNNPFPDNPGFKVSCGLLWTRMRRDGVNIVFAPAYVQHLAPRGVLFFAWRALVAGRDQDRRYQELHSKKLSRRIGHAFSRCFTRIWAAGRRTATHYERVGLSAWQAPLAFLAWAIFSILFLVGQLTQIMTGRSARVEHVPELFKVS
ncbi:MAG: glycosyltransferase family 2 protein [Pseudomonadota bacterium]